jgi:hyperosmotically inducible periplasmic protein
MKRIINDIWSLGMAGTITLFGLTGCSMWESKKANETGRTVNEYKADKQVSDRVAAELKAAPVYKFPSVQVQTYKGNIELSGFVQTQGQKQEADRIARRTPGVQNVVNDLTIVPAAPTPTGRELGYPAPIVNGNNVTNSVPNER